MMVERKMSRIEENTFETKGSNLDSRMKALAVYAEIYLFLALKKRLRRSERRLW